MKILLVCLGNICRSPLAEGILRDKIKRAGLDWETDSAGTGAYHIGKPPHTSSQKVALLNGVDISDLKARQFKKTDMLLFDKIYVMDAENYNNVKAMSEELWDESKIDLFMNELYPGEDRTVPDPWYGTEEDFHAVYKMLDEVSDIIIQKAKHSPQNA